MTGTIAATLDGRTAYESVDMENLSPDERRSVRARTEQMIVVPETNQDGICVGLYMVSSESGEEYTVDLDRPQGCTCPDTMYNDAERCKHRRRVGMTVSETDCPAPGQAIGDYEETLADVRQELERERAALLGSLDTLNTLLDGLNQ